MATKPPLGVMPRYLWVEARMAELDRAINEYTEAGLEVNQDWVAEFHSLKASYHRPVQPDISTQVAANVLAGALVRWSSHRVDKATALSLAYRYLSGEKSNSLVWTVFKNELERVDDGLNP